MPPGKRHFSRANIHPSRITLSNITTTIPDESQKLRKVCPTCINEGLCDIVPLHIPVPRTTGEDPILAEFMVAMFGILCGFFQYFNIYQSGWWLPNAHPPFGVNFQLIDWLVVQFMLFMALRPLIFSVVRIQVMKIVNRFESHKGLSPCLRMILGLIVTIYATIFGVHFWWIYGFIMLLLMFLPWILYIYIYNRNIKDYFDLNVIPLPSAGFVSGRLVHRCATLSQRSRDEVEFLRTDFNARMKNLLFNSFTIAYYCVYIPACFSQGYLYFEDNWTTYYIVLVFFTSICTFFVHYFPVSYYDACHRAALHLGKWTRINGKYTSCYAWVDTIFWYKGIIVKHNGATYRAESLTNSAEPGNKVHEYFYHCFAKPGSLIYWWLSFEISLVCLQFVFLLFSTQWNHILTCCALLLSGYYSLFLCIRYYNLFVTLYKLEDVVQMKMITK